MKKPIVLSLLFGLFSLSQTASASVEVNGIYNGRTLPIVGSRCAVMINETVTNGITQTDLAYQSGSEKVFVSFGGLELAKNLSKISSSDKALVVMHLKADPNDTTTNYNLKIKLNQSLQAIESFQLEKRNPAPIFWDDSAKTWKCQGMTKQEK